MRIKILILTLISIALSGCIGDNPTIHSYIEQIPTIHELSSDEQGQYDYIDSQNIKGASHSIYKNVYVTGEISWIKEKGDGSTEIILDIPDDSEEESITVYFSGKKELNNYDYIDVYGTFRGDDEILKGDKSVKVPMIYAVSVSKLPSLKNLETEEQNEYINIDIRELIKNVPKFFNKKIKISGKVEWIEERNGNTLLIVDIPIPGERFGTETIYINSMGSTDILKGSEITIFGIVKDKSKIYYRTTGAADIVPLIFAVSIVKQALISE